MDNSNDDDDDFFESDIDEESLGRTPVESEKSNQIYDEEDQDINWKIYENAGCDFINTEEFKKFNNLNDVQFNDKYGFMVITLNNKYYFPGQMVRGRIYIQLINKIKTSQAVLKITCEEYTGMSFTLAKLASAFLAPQNLLTATPKNRNEQERRSSSIFAAPTILEHKTQNNDEDSKEDDKHSRKAPSRRGKSEFVEQADQDFDQWLEQK